ncbi:MAG: M3 family oligoendopeptidase [Rickettsiales bacterium]|jgi:oligoendopeptidase F|nr:M3 family oligoendopeptidase [Rickettsiales bacterium]
MIILKDNNLFYKRRKRRRIITFTVASLLALVLLYFLFSRLADSADKIFDNNIFGGAMKNKEKLPSWDLGDLYGGVSDKRIWDDIRDLRERANKFEKYYRGNVKYLSSAEFYNFLKEYENIGEGLEKIYSFASLKHAENLNEENSIFYQTIREELNAVSLKLIFVELEINRLGETEIEEKQRNDRNFIKNYSYFLKNLRRAKKYQLDEQMEKMLLEKSLTSAGAWGRLFDETLNNMTYDFGKKKYNEEQILDIINHNDDSETRQEAGKIFGEKLGENIRLFAFITNTLAKDKAIEDNLRGFKAPISSRNFSNRIDDEDVENLYNSVIKNYPRISHRYYKLKAKMLQKEKLLHTDRNAPLPFAAKRRYSWEEAKTIVLGAYYEFSPKMAEIGRMFFDKKWIDAPTRPGKRAGAFASPVVPSLHPYILLNFTGSFKDVTTMAHELGHGIHMYLSRGQNYLNYDAPLTLAETASVFGEQLVFRHLLKKETQREEKIAILAGKIEDMINTVIRQIAFLEFEKTVHRERREKELTVERLNEIWLDAQRKSLGDIFEFSDEYKYYWAYIPHFIHTPFYVYSYSFGDCLVNTLYDQYRNATSKNSFVDKYLKLLRAGGSDDYVELLKPFDLDPKNEDFWNNGMEIIIELINELEKLLNY